MRLAVSLGLLFLLLGCEAPSSRPRTADEQEMFGPSAMRIHPIFTQVKSWTGGGRPDGVEAVLEFDDRFGDPTKAAGTVVFELFEFRRGYPDPRGERAVNPWTASIVTVDEQQAHWHRETGGYTFQLADEEIRADRNYVLTATFEPLNGTRLFAQTLLAGQKRERGEGATRPAGSEHNTSGDGPQG